MTTHISTTNFSISFFHNVATLELPERLTVLEAIAFKKACHKLLESNPVPEKIILDFKNTEFMDSSGVGALVNNLKATREQGIELLLENVSPSVMAVLSMTGLDMVLKIQKKLHQQQKTKINFPASQTQLPQTHPSINSNIKRLMDIVGSIVGLTITGILFIPIVVAIKLDSDGPIFFGQTRCGWMGKKFKMWKFRSMCVNAEALKSQIPNIAKGAIFKNDNDPRITRVGRFLRKTSLDELPQFWNVLRGEMSLVGTRPPTPDEVERYEVPEWQRLDVKPGMTGEWQVNGRSQILNFEDVIKLDLRYQENWSLLYDIKLIIKTVSILFDKTSGAM
jgi:exopolysaccharide biosynthesis polyprenyl glycosylphosphotransferase